MIKNIFSPLAVIIVVFILIRVVVGGGGTDIVNDTKNEVVIDNANMRLDSKISDTSYAANSAIGNNINTQSESRENQDVSVEKTEYEIGWCFPDEDLGQSDHDFMKQLVADWSEYTGRAYAKSTAVIFEDNYHFENNEFVSPYQELSEEELESRAKGDDKWAKIAFIQLGSFFQIDSMRHVANELLVSGASYHALNFLIRDKLVSAKAAYRKTKDVKLSREHLIDAVAYLFIALEDYNDLALVTYVANVSSDELLSEQLNPQWLLQGFDDEISQRYKELTDNIARKRENNGIDVERAPPEVKQLFSRVLASFYRSDRNVIEQLNDFKTISSADLSVSPCTERHIERLVKIENQ
ncbi:hypothetical protein [Agaribacter marinus]|nr:hypothetical protein [Agaribacter marinus]